MFILLFSLITTPAFAKGSLLEQLHGICLKNSFQEGKSQEAACDCLKANYGKKLSEEDLSLLTRIQTGSITKAEIEGKDELLEFDMEASEHCIEDSAWRWAPEKKTQNNEDAVKTSEPPKATEKAKGHKTKIRPTKPKGAPSKNQ